MLNGPARNLPKALVPLLLGGIFLLRFPAVIVAALGLAVLIAVTSFWRHRHMDRVGWLMVGNYAYWLLSGLLIGGIALSSLLKPAFWSGDGRGFLYYVPLITFCTLSVDRSYLRLVLRTLVAIAVAAIFLLVGYFTFDIEAMDHRADQAGVTAFVGLLTSHTGAGTFFGAVWLFLAIMAVRRKHRWLNLLSVLMLAVVAATISRQAILAAFVVLGVFVLLERRWWMIPKMAMYALIVVVVMGAVRPSNLQRLTELVSLQLLDDIVATIKRSAREVNEGEDLSVSHFRVHNLQTRFAQWTYASKTFLESPVIGSGFGRFNDHKLVWRGVPHLVYLAAQGEREYSEQLRFEQGRIVSLGNTHNSYLQMLSELGVLGLVLLVALWVMMFRRLSGYYRCARAAGDSEIADYMQAARHLVLFALIGALVGNALVAPSVGIVVMTVVGVGLGYGRQAFGDTLPGADSPGARAPG